MARRTQAQRSDATTSALVAAARDRFGRDGYGGTSIEAIAAAAGVTKGAAYHHFDGKAALLKAVFEREQQDVAADLERAAAAEPDPRAALRRGCRTFLERCLDPGFRQITLLDGPAVLGWSAVRAIQYDHTLRVLRAGLRAAAGTETDDATLTARAHMMFGALCEAGMLLARSDDPEADFTTLLAEAGRILDTAVAPDQGS